MPVARTSRPSARATVRAALLLVPVLPVLVLQGLVASAAPSAGPSVVYSDDPHPVSVTFAAVGRPESFTVPAGVTSLEVTAYGASGGSATPNDGSNLTGLGGRGAAVSAVLDVEPGTVLSVNVGGRGGDNGAGGGVAGWNGGGAGGAASRSGAGGGGATDLRTCAPDATGCDSLGSRLVVAAGGGGAGFGYDNVITGADAGADGVGYSANRGTVDGGLAGTATAGGAGGAASEGFDRISRGGDGVLGDGGVGGGRTGPDYEPTIQENAGAGGGGGGLFGGGGGGDNRYYGASGGGGSSLVPTGGGQGLGGPDTGGVLHLTYDLGPVTTVDVVAQPDDLPASGQAVSEVSIAPRTASGVPIAGLTMKIDSSDPGQGFDTFTDHGDGTYSTILHGTTSIGTATLTVSVLAYGDNPTGRATVDTVTYTSPGIKARKSSTKAPRAGWYRTPVTVSFTCTGSRLSAPCPAARTLSASGRHQVVTRTVTDDQGGAATASTSVSLDRVLPRVSVRGARNGATYAAKRRLTCQATDTLSGVSSCRVTTRQRTSGRSTVVTWTGTAYDRAGNKATTTGRYTVRPR